MRGAQEVLVERAKPTVQVLVAYGPLSQGSLTAVEEASPRVSLTYRPIKGSRELAGVLAPDVEVAFINGLPASLKDAGGLRWIQVASAGVDGYRSSPAWQDDRIMITTAAGVAAASIAEYALGMMILYGHRLDRAMQIKDRRAWPATDDEYPPLAAQHLRGQTLGLIGYGRVGQRLAWLARGLGMRVLAIRASARPPRPRFQPAELELIAEGTAGVTMLRPTDLETLLARSDHVVIAVPRTERTVGLVGARELALMQPTSHLVNVARGGIVDEAALADALRAGRPGFATLDVTAEEPLPAASPLYDLPNCRLTPHIAGYFEGYEDRAAEVFLANLRRYLDGMPLLNLVDRAAGY